MKLIINTDGGSRGNPGPSAIGVVARQIDTETNNQVGETIELSKYIGIGTNNQAEYTAVLEALKIVHERFLTEKPEIVFRLDSLLVVQQLNGNYKLKNEGLKPIFYEIRSLIVELGGSTSFMHVPREENKDADRLVNMALDNETNLNLEKSNV